MTDVHLVLPARYDDETRPSGGNTYDQQLSTRLSAHGWAVRTHEVPHAWPAPDRSIAAGVNGRLASIPDGGIVVFDGLLGTAAATQLVAHARRLRLVALVHMPGPPGGPPTAVLNAARLVITPSEWAARTLMAQHRLAADKLLVACPGAPEADLAAGGIAGDALLCVAAVTRAKGHDVLFAALATLRDTPWTCQCVGALELEPGFVEQQRQVLADAGIADRVRLRGPLAGANLDGAYAAADVLVFPTRLDSYGMVVTEALARGLPVIASEVGGVPEALGHAGDGQTPGILVPPGDPHRLAAAITDWLANGVVRANLRAAARNRRATLGRWQQTVTVISAALDRLATT